MKLTFDPIKNLINIKGHQIDLNDVEGVFYDDYAVTIEDRDHTEERFVTLGMDNFGRLLVVAYHYRSEEEIRVISARKAEPHEQRTYQEG
ncbi:MAG: BrnT family toxin [Candidatus Moranbacteria bacterium]|nr:BrnT family toxin [Candidatus Moranbacteria bacterium]